MFAPATRMAMVRSYQEQHGIKFHDALRIFNRLDREMPEVYGEDGQKEFDRRYAEAVLAMREDAL